LNKQAPALSSLKFTSNNAILVAEPATLGLRAFSPHAAAGSWHNQQNLPEKPMPASTAHIKLRIHPQMKQLINHMK